MKTNVPHERFRFVAEVRRETLMFMVEMAEGTTVRKFRKGEQMAGEMEPHKTGTKDGRPTNVYAISYMMAYEIQVRNGDDVIAFEMRNGKIVYV